MEEEIDLRVYIKVLIRYWKWIVGLALVAAVTAFVVSLLLPFTYEPSSSKYHELGSVRGSPGLFFDNRIELLVDL